MYFNISVKFRAIPTAALILSVIAASLSALPVNAAAAATETTKETSAAAETTAAAETARPAETTEPAGTTASAETAGSPDTPVLAGLTALPRSIPTDIERILGSEEGEKNRYVAHTGRCGKAAQNSLLAFQLAAEAGYWAIETDIRWTSDRVIICYHDESFDTHSDGSGMVEDCPWDYVKTISVTAGCIDETGPQPVASFADYLDLCKETGRQALVDVKYCSNGYKEFLDTAYQMVADRDMVSRTIWQCSLGDYLTYIKSLDPNARCWLLCGEIVADDPDLIVHAKQDLQCEGIDVPVIDQAVAEQAHANGMICVFYETDKKDKQDRCFEYGYDLVMENGLD